MIIGVAMGLTAIAIIYSPWGKQSGAHINPVVTLTFFRLGKVKPIDTMILVISNTPKLARFTGLFAGLLIAIYITLEAPLSGMSMNPAITITVVSSGVATDSRQGGLTHTY